MIPTCFADQTITTYGDRGRHWIEELPALIMFLSARWDIDVDPPFPGLTWNYVAPATERGGRRCVLKIGVGSPEGAREPIALAAYAGKGAVHLYRHDTAAHAMLLERIGSGADLVQVPDPRACEIAADVLRQLWTAAPVDGLEDLEPWTASLDNFVHNPGPLPPKLLDRAAGLRRELLENPPERVLLHGDLHHTNILHSDKRGWVAIDPKGVVGERAYDLVAFFTNPTQVSVETTRLRIDAFVERLALDRERVVAWAFVQSIVSACWTIEDGGDWWEGAVRFAEEIKEIGGI